MQPAGRPSCSASRPLGPARPPPAACVDEHAIEGVPVLLVERLTGGTRHTLDERTCGSCRHRARPAMVLRRRGDHAGLSPPHSLRGDITGGAEQHDHVRFERRTHASRRIMALMHTICSCTWYEPRPIEAPSVEPTVAAVGWSAAGERFEGPRARHREQRASPAVRRADVGASQPLLRQLMALANRMNRVCPAGASSVVVGLDVALALEV